MNASRKLLLGLALGSLLLGGCTSKITTSQQYSGFLESYENLQKVTTPSGGIVLRWVSPSWNPDAYDTVVFKRMELFPSPKPTDRVNQATLDQLQAHLTSNARGTFSQKYRVLSDAASAPANAHVLVARVAITGVDASNEGMKWYEVVPVAALVGTVGAVTGHRDQNTELYLEAELIDARTAQSVVRVVRKVLGKSVKNASQPVTTEAFKDAIIGLNNDLRALLR